MELAYQNNLPVVPIEVRGARGEVELQAHLDFAATKTVIPVRVSEQAGLALRGYAAFATAGGSVLLPLYGARIHVFDREFELDLGCLDLPVESPVQALLGRDILDGYMICLNGKTKSFTVTDP